VRRKTELRTLVAIAAYVTTGAAVVAILCDCAKEAFVMTLVAAGWIMLDEALDRLDGR